MNNDITFCVNHDCPLAEKCRRSFVFPPRGNKPYVSMSKFEFVITDGKAICDNILNVKESNE